MDWKRELKVLGLLAAAFVAIFFLPVGAARFDGAVLESLRLLKWYAREHVLLCLVPAFFIAGALGVFVSQGAVIRHLGARANKLVSYTVASVSGLLIAVCSCTVLPLFGGIYKRGAGLGPAIAFLYSGPAISVLAIVLTARILGPEMGIARGVGAVALGVVIGLLMAGVHRREELVRQQGLLADADAPPGRPLWQTAALFGSLLGILVFANLGRPESAAGPWHALWTWKWPLTSVSAVAFAATLVRWYGIALWKILAVAAPVAALALAAPGAVPAAFTVGAVGLSVLLARTPGEPEDWFGQTWDFAKKILPLLFAGVVVSGFLLGAPAMDGRPATDGVIPREWVSRLLGGNSWSANFFASIFGAFMYFATLTEVPIIQGLLNAGMGKGPALALLLAGPAVSLPSLLVIRSLLGTKKTLTFLAFVVTLATVAGWFFGRISPG